MLTLDLSLIRDYTKADSVYRPVAATHFSREGHDLYYINACHVKGIDNPTCETIRQAIAEFLPAYIVIECRTNGKISHPELLHASHQQAQSGFKSEDIYAAYLADQHQISFIGGEPTDNFIFTAMEKIGYAPQSLAAFYVLRQAAWMSEKGEPAASRFACGPDRYISDIASVAGVPSQYRINFQEFKSWYDQQGLKDRDFLQINIQDFAPFADGTNLQKMSRDLGNVREENIDRVITDSLNTYKKVLVVYGDGHLVQSRPVFEAMLGAGQTIQLVQDQYTVIRTTTNSGPKLRCPAIS